MLHYDDNGGSGCSSKTITRNAGESWGTLCTPTRSGYAFKGWNTKKDGTGTKITKSSNNGKIFNDLDNYVKDLIDNQYKEKY